MTLLIGYRHNQPTANGDAAVFLNDLRLTWNKGDNRNQADAQMKWEFFNRKENVQLAYMTAGSVRFWRFARDYVSGVSNELTISDTCSVNGPLHSALLQATLDYPGYLQQQGYAHKASRVGAIGACMNCDADEVTFFTVRGETGKGVRVDEIEPGSVEIMGSGAKAPDLQQRLEGAAARGRSAYGDDLSRIGHGIRNEALETIQGAGGRAFSKLGVSPVIAMHVSEGARLQFLGERVVGNKTHKGVHYPSAYTLRRSPEHGFLLCDEEAGVHQPVQPNLDDAEDAKGRGVLDPENRTLSTDVSGHFPDMTCAYQFIQARMQGVRSSNEELEELKSTWIHSLVEQARDPDGAWFAKHVIYRRLSLIEFVGDKRLQQVTKLAERVKFVDSDSSLEEYSDIETYFSLKENKRKEMEENIGPDKLFDADWIEEYAGAVFED